MGYFVWCGIAIDRWRRERLCRQIERLVLVATHPIAGRGTAVAGIRSLSGKMIGSPVGRLLKL